MKKILTVLLIVVTAFAFCACGDDGLEGSYTTNNLITFDFYPDGTYYVATYESSVEKGEYTKGDEDNTYKLTVQGQELGTATYDEKNDNMTIDIAGNALLYTKVDDVNYKDKYKKASDDSEKSKDSKATEKTEDTEKAE